MASSTPQDHPAIHKLDVLRARIRRHINEHLDRDEYDRALELIQRLKGIEASLRTLLEPDASYSEP